MHFLALYNAVLALGSLTAPLDALRKEREELEIRTEEDRKRGPKFVPSSIRLSKLYVQRARRLLGDTFEVCSLEGVQTLLLLSIYSQHALKIHASFMYSGMATRTAIAIGLPAMASTCKDDVASRTWSCIYIQDIKVSCSSGRSIVLPSFAAPVDATFKASLHISNVEESQDSIIPAQLGLYDVLRAASTDLYHSSRDLTLEERADVASQLERKLDLWVANLPSWLRPDSVSFDESESASRQKLTLHIRFLQTKMFIYRPFLAGSTNPLLSHQQTVTCLAAAHASIDLIFSAFTHRIYFRTWWYNATHIFYATIIIIYIILMHDGQDIVSTASLSMEELSSDIQKSLKMLRAMDSMPVIVRYADLIEQVLKASSNEGETVSDDNQESGGVADLQNATTHWNRNTENNNDESQGESHLVANPSLDNLAFLAHEVRGLERDDLLLSLMDPSLLDDLTMENYGDMSSNFAADDTGIDYYASSNFASGQVNDSRSWHEE
ncbi:uncharacterized protein LY89DRAFT_242402 [Mollisia scopiformis]|uniref:Xylanolytic transcriptional activator regulatory domain-containing protein n=1 Tax=Mollisia scopiformis TaxID=149040 RepID=A0A194WTN5_MOLSC|nr:uncharacterized protein LY89DRAFT_242402 [Mollisia scopiformis]KUJ11318.1 hypothetical protein LY89DRAFT_242402 [Mollisia scopiformis]